MSYSNLMKVLDGTKHLGHDVGCLSFSELLRTHNLIEKLSAIANLHYDMKVTVVDVAFIEFYDVGMINFLEYGKFFFKQRNVLLNFFSKD